MEFSRWRRGVVSDGRWSMPFIEVQRSLEAWWEAVRKVEIEQPDTDARRRAEERAEARRREYQTALLRAIGIVDQLDAATRTSSERLEATRDLLSSGKRYVRRHRARSKPEPDAEQHP